MVNSELFAAAKSIFYFICNDDKQNGRFCQIHFSLFTIHYSLFTIMTAYACRDTAVPPPCSYPRWG